MNQKVIKISKGNNNTATVQLELFFYKKKVRNNFAKTTINERRISTENIIQYYKQLKNIINIISYFFQGIKRISSLPIRTL